MTDFVDHGDFCRRCGGHGTFREKTERGTFLVTDCDLCRGTGLRTVALTVPAHACHVLPNSAFDDEVYGAA